MFVVSSVYGSALVFDDEQDLECVIGGLQAELDRIRSKNIEVPHIYFVGLAAVDETELRQWTRWLKWTLGEGYRVDEPV